MDMSTQCAYPSQGGRAILLPTLQRKVFMTRSTNLGVLYLIVVTLMVLCLVIVGSADAQPCPTWPEGAVPDATIVVDGSLWDPQGDSFTIMFSMFVPEEGMLALNYNLIRKGGNILIAVSPPSIIQFVVVDTQGDVRIVDALSSFDAGDWIDVAAVLDRGEDEVRLYIDSVLQDTASWTGKDVAYTALDELCFGCLDVATSSFIGQICEIELISIPLVQQQVMDAHLVAMSMREHLLAYWPGVVDETQSPRDLIDFGPDSHTFHPSPWAGDLSSSIVVE